ncbi:MAG: DinB family protein [Rhodothermales bacterium]|nr:DinB family protein [Rhodothermales bacterium]
MATLPTPAPFITADAFLEHWQGHRRLTRRVIEAFPEDAFTSYSIGGMRPFSLLVKEMLGMAIPTIKGVATGKWEYDEGPTLSSKAEALRLWDEVTTKMNEIWPTIPANRFPKVDLAFGQWEGPGHWIIHYIVDNEIHHRAQGYVYLRSLGIAPPAFYER